MEEIAYHVLIQNMAAKSLLLKGNDRGKCQDGFVFSKEQESITQIKSISLSTLVLYAATINGRVVEAMLNVIEYTGGIHTIKTALSTTDSFHLVPESLLWPTFLQINLLSSRQNILFVSLYLQVYLVFIHH